MEELARKIAADATYLVTLEDARSAAQGEFGIARLRQAKVALIERMLAFGELDPPPLFRSVRQAVRFLEAAWDSGELRFPADRRRFRDNAISRGGSSGRSGATGVAGTDKA